MSGQKPGDIPLQEFSDLIIKGNELYELLEESTLFNEHDYQKKRNMFIADYNKWYALCLHLIRSVIPERAGKFESFYHTNNRSATNEYTYTLQDYIQGIYFKDKPKSYTDNIAAKKLKEQITILENTLPKANDFSFEMDKFVRINPSNTQPSSAISMQNNLINIDFPEHHYNAIKTEINVCFKHGFYLAAYLLSSELIRNLLLDMIRIRYPPKSAENASLYFDLQNTSHKEIRPLIGLIREKEEEFDINPEALEYLAEMIDIFKPKTKPESHSFPVITAKEQFENLRIEEITQLLLDIIDFMTGKT